MIESEVLPFFRAVGTLENHVALQRRHYMWAPIHMQMSDMILDIALGDLAEATKKFDVLWECYRGHLKDCHENRTPASAGFHKALSILTMLRDDLLSENRVGLARTLFAWESENIARLEAERLWEPTPFPLERDGGGSWPVCEDVVARLEGMIKLTPRTIWADKT